MIKQFNDSSDVARNDSQSVIIYNSGNQLQNKINKGNGNQPPSLEELIQLGIHAEKDSKYPEALTYYEKAVTIAPLDLQAITHQSLCLCKLNRLNDALKYLNDLITMYKDNLEYESIKGQCYLSLNQFKQAIDLFNNCLSIKKYHEKSLVGKAICLMETNQLDEAEKIFLDFPNNKEANFFLGLCFYRNQKYKDAISRLEIAVKENYKHNKLYITLAQSYEIIGNFQKASFFYEKQLKNEVSAQTYFKLGFCYYQLKHYNKAKRNLNLCIALDKDNKDAKELLIASCINTKKIKEALEEYHKMIQENRNNIQAYIDAAQLYIDGGMYEEAKGLLIQAHERVNKDSNNEELKKHLPKIDQLLQTIDSEKEKKNQNASCQCSFCLIF